jgi:hypothetical protein
MEAMVVGKPELGYELTEVDGDRYPSLEALQADLLEPLAEALAIVIRERRAGGKSVVSDGRVVFAEDAILSDDAVYE